MELAEEGRRPVCVLTRDEAIPKLRNVVVALVTRTIRGIETEVQLDTSDGMPRECAISLDNLRTVPKALLVEPITELSAGKMNEVCRPLRLQPAAANARGSNVTPTSRYPRRCPSGNRALFE